MQNAYVRKLHEKEMDETKHDSLWFLPHHPVFNPFNPYRARRVYNAAASYKGESLNYKLLTVIDLLQNLLRINFRFREHQIAFSVHIEALYLQVKVPPQNCPILRFRWKSEHEDNSGVYDYIGHVFGAKISLICANYALLQAGVDNKESHLMIGNDNKKIFYIDDFANSVATTEEAMHVYRKA